VTRDEMTFAPTSPGFKPRTTVTVRISDTATAENVKRSYAGFEARYRCGDK
jgi:hypothetical protein